MISQAVNAVAVWITPNLRFCEIFYSSGLEIYVAPAGGVDPVGEEVGGVGGAVWLLTGVDDCIPASRSICCCRSIAACCAGVRDFVFLLEDEEEERDEEGDEEGDEEADFDHPCFVQ